MAASLTQAQEQQTDLQCAQCDKEIHVGEHIVTLRVVCPTAYDTENGEIIYTDYVNEENDDFMYDPFSFHQECWAEVFTDTEALIRDDKPVGWAGGVSECDVCSSDILREETTALITPGKIVLSRRRPNNEPSLTLTDHGAKQSICIACLAKMNEHVLEMWDGGISQEGECEEGLKERCWRTGCQTHCKKLT